MASSGTFSGSIRSGHYALSISWTQTPNVSANTSTIQVSIALINDWSLQVSGRTDNRITIDGTTQTFSSPGVYSTGTHQFNTVSQVVNHNSDGTKTLTITAVYYIRATLSGTYYDSITATATITLDTIPRASTVTAPDGTIGTALTLTVNRASTAFVHTLTYSFGARSGTIASRTTSTSISWTPLMSLCNQIPNAISGTCTITCTTYNGTTQIGTSTSYLTLTVPSSVVPTISDLIVTRVDGDVPSSWGVYVATKSKATVTIQGAAGSYGSTISSYSITGGGYSSSESSLTTGFLNSSGAITFRARVTDSRGRFSDYATVSITVQSYSVPSFTSYESDRCTSDGVLSGDGTYIQALNRFRYSSCNGHNSVTTQIEYKRSTESTWTTDPGNFSSNVACIFGGGLISTEYSYDIRYTLTDAFSSVSVLDVVSTAAVFMDFKAGGTGIAFGKVAEDDGMDVDMNAHFRRDVTLDSDLKVTGETRLNGLSYFTGRVSFSGDATFYGNVSGFAKCYYGTCTTSASTTSKTVTCANFTRAVGAIVTIFMSNANTATSPRLNINGTGLTYLAYGGVRISGAYRWLAQSMVTVMFTGTYYEVLSIGATWNPAVSGAGSYSYREGHFNYQGGLVTLSWCVSGTFSSTTTTSTVTSITGLPFTNHGQGVASGGGVAYGCRVTGASFGGWCISSGESSIGGRSESITTNGTVTLGSMYNYPSMTFTLSGTIQMRVLD